MHAVSRRPPLPYGRVMTLAVPQDRIDRPLLGMALMLGFCVLAPLGDAAAKSLGGRVPVVEILFVRFLMPIALIPFTSIGSRAILTDARLLRLTALRAALHVTATFCFFTSLIYMELADAVAIAFAMPFVLLVIGRVWMDERVGPRRLAACVAGFVGTLLVVQPSFASVGWPALLPLAVAVLFALFMLVTRVLARETDAVALQAVGGLIATPFLAVAMLAGAATGLVAPVWPEGLDAALLLAAGTIGIVAHLTMTWSLRFVAASTVAPMQYLEIPFAVLIGWLAFGDWPDGFAALGIVVIVAAGLAVVWLERQAQTRQA